MWNAVPESCPTLTTTCHWWILEKICKTISRQRVFNSSKKYAIRWCKAESWLTEEVKSTLKWSTLSYCLLLTKLLELANLLTSLTKSQWSCSSWWLSTSTQKLEVTSLTVLWMNWDIQTTIPTTSPASFSIYSLSQTMKILKNRSLRSSSSACKPTDHSHGVSW